MATSAFWYQHKAHLLCVESTQYGLSEKTGLASSFQQGGWLRVWNTACLGMLIYLHPPRPPYYPCVNGRKYVASNGRCHDVNNFSPALLLSDRRRCERANRSCNALSSSEVEEHEDEGANIFRRSVAHATTLERVILSAVERTDLDEELLDEEDRITGALRIGVVGCRRSASWICFGGGARPRRKRAWKTTNKKGSIAKARKLVDIISELPSAKEEIYGALDAFVAWELEFPIIAMKKALQLMAEAEQWKRVIQVTKWMLSKGQARTLGTYTLLLQALDYEGRVEEADALWEKLLTENEDATPRIMFTVVIAMFERHNQLKRLLQVFADMEELEVKPDIVTVERVARAYRSLGLMKRAALVEAKYPPTQWAWRYSKRGKKYRIRVTADGQIIKPEKPSQSGSEADEEGEEDDVRDSDSEHDDVFEEESVGEKPTLLNSDSVLPSVGYRP